jgi:hypothetical protein
MWSEQQGVMTLPSGRQIRGRALQNPLPQGDLPDVGLYLCGWRSRFPGLISWEYRTLVWPNFWLPKDRQEARRVYRELWERSATERVEVACFGGRGRTGTALACVAILDGVSPNKAVDFVRVNYHPKAVETPGQRRYVGSFVD